MKSDRQHPPIAIIGGGFSGTALLAELTRRGVPAVLIEGGGRAGQGAAYSTREPAHLLNVRAEVMSARHDDLDHFVRFVESEGGTRHDFVQRRQFGRYLQDELEQARVAGAVLITDQAVGAVRVDDGWRVELGSGENVQASGLVLALGNQAPEPLRMFDDCGPRFINNPWSEEARDAVTDAAEHGSDVMLLGTGLTMVDAALSLDAAGHQGRILALSRRGLIPRGHVEQPGPPAPVDVDELPAGNVLAMWRWLRSRAGQVEWRTAVDSLRPHTHVLWQGFSEAEQRRFLRHARAWWDVHRHRIAPQVSKTIKAMVADGRLQVLAGRVRQATSERDAIEVTMGPRGKTTEEVRSFSHVLNCTGPLGTIGRTRDLLLRQLLDDGSVRPDALGIALDVDARSRVPGTGRLWALGPMTKGKYWEIIAVPDIRVQVAGVADDIVEELSQ